MEISKEIASSVLGINVVYTESCEHRDNIIGIWADMNTNPIKEVNIYEFAFKCKEWAFTSGFELKSGRDNLCYFCEYKREDQIDYQNEDYFLGSSEIEAIIKACEWILEQSKCQN